MKKHVAGVILAILLGLSLSWYSDPDLRFGVVCLWAATAMIALNELRGRKRAGIASAPAQTFVSLALARPTRSPAVQQAYAALPAYCFSPRR